MDEWVLWVILAVALGVGEILTPSFFLAPFALGAGVAAVASLVGAPLVASLALFLVASVALLVLVRPIARRHLYAPPTIRTGTAALIGRSAEILDTVDAHGGSAKIDGEIWTARPYDDDRTIEPGERVEVMEIRGATALLG